MLIYTLGFADDKDLQRHFIKHGMEFGVSTAAEYETLADRFMGGPKTASVHECSRKKDGDILRFDATTDFFGAMKVGNVIRTLYKPIPCISVPATQRAAFRRGRRCHPETSNLVYFQSECAK